MSDWIPAQELKKIERMQTWKIELEKDDNLSAYGWDSTECIAVLAKIEAALNTHAAYEADKTAAKRIAKYHAMHEAVEAMREFANASIRFNKRMPPEARLPFGIHEKDTQPTEGGEPQTLANITSLKPLGGATVEIRFQDENTPHSWAIPAAYNGCLLSYAAGAEKVTDYALLTKTELMTNHIWRLELPPGAAGSWLSLAVRWQSHTGIKGRWSEILHIAVS